MADFDLAIIGQGLAGTTLAWAARWAGARVLVADRGEAETCSRVAAGLMTPVTGKRLAATWRLGELWPAAVAFYRRAEADTGATFFRPRRIVRLFRDAAERDLYESRKETEFRGWVGSPDPPLDSAAFAASFGAFEMPAAGQLLVADFLDASRRRFAADGGYATADVDPASDIVVSPDGVSLPRLGVRARAVVFCQGVAARGNPWFPAGRLFATKGDILTVRVPGLNEDRVVNRGVWLAPAGGDVYRVGATYVHDAADATPTAAGRAELCDRLRAFLRLPFEVTDHRAGVRPVAPDHRPLVGLHPGEPRVGYFNGLGSKGTLAAPFFAAEFVASLKSGGVL